MPKRSFLEMQEIDEATAVNNVVHAWTLYFHYAKNVHLPTTSDIQ